MRDSVQGAGSPTIPCASSRAETARGRGEGESREARGRGTCSTSCVLMTMLTMMASSSGFQSQQVRKELEDAQKGQTMLVERLISCCKEVRAVRLLYNLPVSSVVLSDRDRTSAAQRGAYAALIRLSPRRAGEEGQSSKDGNLRRGERGQLTMNRLQYQSLYLNARTHAHTFLSQSIFREIPFILNQKTVNHLLASFNHAACSFVPKVSDVCTRLVRLQIFLS